MLWNSRRPTDIVKPLAVLAAGVLLTLPAISHAQTTTTTVSTTVSAPDIPATRKPIGLKTAVVAATDTGGDTEVALRALQATHIALLRSPGFVLMSPSTVSASLQKAGLRYPFAPREYENVRKSLDKAPRIVAVTVTPGDVTDAAATYHAVVEMYDTSNGGLVGRGEGNYTADADSTALVSTTTTVTTAAPAGDVVLGTFAVPAGTAGAPVTAATATTTTTTTTAAAPQNDYRLLAVDGAILRAVEQMNEPAVLTGIVVSLPDQQMARLSLGQMHGLRNGSRVEYLVRGVPFAYGTVVDVGKGDALATVAPEKAFPLIEVNSDWRTAGIPPKGTAGPTRDQIDEREWKKFERNFGIAGAIVGAAYLLYTGVIQ